MANKNRNLCKIPAILSVIIFTLLLLPSVWALSNNSIESNKNINLAKACFEEMQSRNLPLQRANASLQEALQLYEAQFALETQTRSAEYKLVNQFSAEVCLIKENAFKAADELDVFNTTFWNAASGLNLSEMYPEYDAIIKSFTDERFEDTLRLINLGYGKLSEVESKQTAIRLFYDSTSRTLKTIVIKNWKAISITIAVILIVVATFWNPIKKSLINRKMRHLQAKRNSLNTLIKNLQRAYFSKKSISDLEFEVKLKKFKEIILDIDRQIPMLKEGLAKLKRGKV